MERKENYALAVRAIKTAILQGQYTAAKDTNRIQLATYFAIGKYISENSRHGFWGKGAIEMISEQLRRELPGLRGFSATSMKSMRKFYEQWDFLDSKKPNSAIAIAELQNNEYQINIQESIVISNVANFPVNDFFSVPFTHHIRILEKTESTDERFYYFRRCVAEHLSVNGLVNIIKQGEFKPSYLGQLAAYLRILDDKIRKPHENQAIGIILCKSANKEYVEYIIQDYNKPMDVATFKTQADMPEKLRNALPPVEELKKLL